MIQFGTIFLVFLFSFSGAFYLALRGEVLDGEPGSCTVDGLDCNSTGAAENGSMPVSENASLNSSLNIYPFETSYVCLMMLYTYTKHCKEFLLILHMQ